MLSARFLLINDLGNDDEGAMRGALERLLHAARARGVSPAETFYSLERRRAYTIVDADSAHTVRDLAEKVGLHVLDVMPGERLYTDLLEPHRAH